MTEKIAAVISSSENSKNILRELLQCVSRIGIAFDVINDNGKFIKKQSFIQANFYEKLEICLFPIIQK